MPLPDISRQQRNMAKLAPLMRLDAQKNQVFRSLPEHQRELIDLKQAILFMLDHVMVHSGLGLGVDPAESKEAVSAAMAEVTRLGSETTDRIAATVHDWLLQPDGRTGIFREPYYDCPSGEWRLEEFRYLRIIVDEITGQPLLRLGDAGAIIHLGMLDLDDRFAAEIEAEIIRRAIHRGKFDDALDAATRALKRSQKFRADLTTHLIHARRSRGGGRWAEEVLPMLEEARTHLEERQQDDATVIAAIDEKIDGLVNDADSLRKAFAVRSLVERCQVMHSALFVDVVEANERFRQLQIRAFSARRAERTPDPEEGVLLPLLSAPIGSVTAIADLIGSALSTASAPPQLDLAQFFSAIATEELAEDLPDEGGPTEIPLEQLPPLYDEAFIRRIDTALITVAGEQGEVSLPNAVVLLEQDYRRPTTIPLIADTPIAICSPLPCAIPPPINCLRSSPRAILPFRLRR